MKKIWFPVVVLVITAICVYRPARNLEFINYDDPVYVTEHHQVSGGLTVEGIRWALTNQHGGNWHPLTTISHMIDVELFGMEPEGHHIVNVALHTFNVVLLFFFILRLTGSSWWAFMVAGLFALHPLNVQSVAWVSERKNLLSTVFWLGALTIYIGYLRRPAGRLYAAVIALFVLGLLSKPMVVTLPLTMALVALYLRRELPGDTFSRNLLRDLAPAIAISAVFSFITVLAQEGGGALQGAGEYTVGVRIGTACIGYGWYLVKAIWPAELSVFYPHPLETIDWQTVLYSFASLTAVTVAVAFLGKRRRYLWFGWPWYLLTLLPVIGLVQVGSQAYADRYAYVPLIGIFVIAAGAVVESVGERNVIWKRIAGCAGVVILVSMAMATSREIGYWRDSITLFQRAVAIDGKNSVAHDNLGTALAQQGRIAEAVPHFRAAIANARQPAYAHTNLGNALAMLGKRREAVSEYEQALRLKPEDYMARFNMGRVLASMGRVDEARTAYREALALAPRDSSIHDRIERQLAGMEH